MLVSYKNYNSYATSAPFFIDIIMLPWKKKAIRNFDKKNSEAVVVSWDRPFLWLRKFRTSRVF